MSSRTTRIVLATAAGFMCLFISDNWSSLRQADLIAKAEAVIGRPATPGSVAGAARRTTRRAVRRGAYYNAAPYYGTRAYYPSGYYRGY